MKLFILFFCGILISNAAFGQTNFRWEKTDSVSKTKAQIYSDTKMFISETWRSTKDVIQNDDKENGIILIKGLAVRNIVAMNGRYIYTYVYTVTFKQKDGKYKIILDNVHCVSAEESSGKFGSMNLIEPFEGDNYPDVGRQWGASKRKMIEMMPLLKQDLQSIVDSYEKYIKKQNASKDDW